MNESKDAAKISCDDDAWNLLSDWLNGKYNDEAKFEGWPILGIKLKGDDYQASLNSGQMSALVDLKMTMGRAYAVLAHGAYDMRRLKEEEEEDLRFTTSVKPGSSLLDTDLSPLIQAFASAVSSHPGTSVAAATIIGLALVARPVIIRYFDDRAKQLEAGERKMLVDLALNRDDTKKIELFDRAVDKLEKLHPQMAQALPDARSAFWRFASASVDADEVTVAGLNMGQDDLEILAERRKRRNGEYREARGTFTVTAVKSAGSSFRIGLDSKQLSLTATYRKPQLTDTRIKRLMNCLASRTPIDAHLEVKDVGKAHLSSRLIWFAPVKAATDKE